jgi:hypothetical protein
MRPRSTERQKRKMNSTTRDSKPIFHCNLAKFATITEVTALPPSFDWNTNREKNEMLCMRIKLRVLHKAYKHVFEQLYPSQSQDLQNKGEST